MWPGWGGVGLLLLGSAAWGAGWPQMQTIISWQVGSARRATVLSVAGAGVRLGFIPLSATIGMLHAGHGVAVAVLGLAAILFVLGGPALFWLWRAASGSIGSEQAQAGNDRAIYMVTVYLIRHGLGMHQILED